MEMLAPTVEDSAAILRALLGNTGLEADQIADVEKLTNISCHPLAMIIMAAYIHTARISIDKYVSQFETFARASRSQASAISSEVSAADHSMDDIIYFSLGRVYNNDMPAARCLFEMACLHQTDIPMTFVRDRYGDKMGDVLATLESYALVTRRPALAAVDIHSLVHVAMRQLLEGDRSIAGLSRRRTAGPIEDISGYQPEEQEPLETAFAAHILHLCQGCCWKREP